MWGCVIRIFGLLIGLLGSHLGHVSDWTCGGWVGCSWKLVALRVPCADCYNFWAIRTMTCGLLGFCVLFLNFAIFLHLIVTCLGCFLFVLLFVLGGVCVWEGVMCLCEFRGCGVYVIVWVFVVCVDCVIACAGRLIDSFVKYNTLGYDDVSFWFGVGNLCCLVV